MTDAILKQMQLDMMLRLEERIEGHKQRVDETLRSQMLFAQNDYGDQEYTPVDILEGEIQGHIENWLNVLDRLASMIINGLVPEMDWKDDYQGYLSGLPDSFRDVYTAETYNNIAELIDRWKVED